MSEEIKQLDELLGQKVRSQKVKTLTQPGENYGSSIASLEVALENGETLHLVAKMYPKSSHIAKMFNTKVTFVKELGFYSTAVPALEAFKKENGVVTDGLFPGYYGGRLGLKDFDVVDEDAVLLLENLKENNYAIGDRLIGFGAKEAELIVRKLAEFHAVPIAYKLKRPESFEKNVKKFLNSPKMFEEADHASFAEGMQHILDIISSNPETAKIDVKKYFNPEEPPHNYGEDDQREPYSTITHNDFWVNNMLIKCENSEPTSIAIVDFQVIEYGSFARDLIFFLFSSVQPQILETNLDNYLNTYYTTFVEILQKFGCTHLGDFSRESYEKELDIEAKLQLGHVLFMFFPILTKPEMATASDELGEDMLKLDPGKLSGEFGLRVCETARLMHKKGWI